MRSARILFVLPYGFNDRMMIFPEYTISRVLARNGWYVVGITRREDGEPKKHTVHGIRVFRYESALSGIFRTALILITSRPDIVHVHTLRNNRVGVVAALLAKLLRIPLVFTEAGLLHDDYLVSDRDDPIGKFINYAAVQHKFHLGRLKNYFYHWPLTHADAVVFFSRHNVPIAEKLGVKSAQYVPMILDNLRWKSATPGGNVEQALPAEPYGLFIGQMKARKGWDVLLRAIPYIAPEILPKFVFVSSTSQKETEDFTALVDSLGIRDRILYLGKLPSSEDLYSALERSTVVIVPSLYEGFGLVPLDAFEAQKPVIASEVEALTDFLRHNENAYLVAPKDSIALADGIMAIMESGVLREKLIAGGLETLAHMKSKASADRWLDFYNSLILR